MTPAPTDELLQAMAEVGLHPKDIHWDGRFHRFPGIGQKDRGDNGWVKAFADQRGAIFGDNRTKEKWKWPQDSPEWKEAMQHAERLTREEVERRKEAAKKERAKAAEKATKIIHETWNRAKLCPNHPYLERKGIRDVQVLRSIIDPKTREQILLIPMRNHKREIVCIQRIWPDGTRKYMWQPGGTRGLYDTIGARRFRETKTLVICEGWATGHSIHQATGHAVIVAFFDGGLRVVGKIIQKKYPDARIIIAADNDRWKFVKRGNEMVNPGVYAAREAAEKLGVEYCIPDFEDLSTKPTDFDDLRRLEGEEAVARWLDPEMADKAATEAPREPEPETEPDPDPRVEPEPDDCPPEEEYIPRRDLADRQKRYRVDPAALAHRLLDRIAARVLIVGQEDESTTALMLLPSGRWTNSPEPWNIALLRELKELLADIGSDVADKTMPVPDAKRRTNRVHIALRDIASTVRKTRGAMYSAWETYMAPHKQTAMFDRPRIVRHDQLDADLDCIGFENGVVHLPTGELLDQAAGADRLVTRSTGIRFDPKKASQADALFAHLETVLRRFWIRVLAWILRGRPSRRIWLVVGERNSAKTTISTAMQAMLGDSYSATLMPDAVVKRRADRPPQGTFVIGHPRRIACLEEPPTAKLDGEFLKAASGGGRIAVKKLYRDPVDMLATASIVIFCNPGKSVPRLGLDDAALRDRVRELPFPELPHDRRDPAFLADVVPSTDFREALAAKLIAAGVGMTRPPRSPKVVQKATQQRLELDLTDLQHFLRRIVPGSVDDFLSSDDAWREWCLENELEEPPRELAGKVGDYTRTGFGNQIRNHTGAKACRKRVGGVQKRGWEGWTLTESAGSPPARGRGGPSRA
ncbi:MAG: toprim domain-containing protein [Gammaproteobacteria bacterium]|nr:toprim domain-containing protein [Gammaproteobacteria bacterium]